MLCAVAWVFTVVVLAALGALTWWAYRTDPHWVAKDGRAFTCRFQRLGGPHLMPEGRWREARAFVDGHQLVLRPRGPFTSGAFSGHFEVVRRGDDLSKERAVYLVDGGGINRHEFAQIRLPASSRATAVLDSLVEATAAATADAVAELDDQDDDGRDG